MTEDIIDEIVSLAATQIDAALDSGSSHASDMKYLAEFREDLNMSVFKQGLIVLVIGILLLAFPEIVTLGIIEDWFIAMGVVLIFVAIVIILSDMIYRSFGSK